MVLLHIHWRCPAVIPVRCAHGSRVLWHVQPGTPRYSDRLCSDRRYSDNPQSGRRRRVAGLLQLMRLAGSTDWKDAEPNACVGALEVRCNFSGKGAPLASPEIRNTPTGPTPLGHLCAWINGVLSMHATPRPPSNYIPISTIPTTYA